MKFDFLFLDTAYISPGKLINLIEVLPFLEENAIIVLHDIVWHHLKESEFTQLKSISSPSLLLISTLHEDKVLIKNMKILKIWVQFFYMKTKRNII